MGRSASGVTGMKLAVDDEVIALRVPGPEDDVLVITDGGYGKRTPITEYRETGRGAKGVRTISAKAEADRGPLVAAHCVTGEEDLIVTTAGGIVTRMSVGEVRSMGRSTSGVRIQRIKGEEDRVSSCAIVPAEEDVPEDEAVPPKAEAEVKDAVEVPPQADAAQAEALADAADGDPGDDQEIGPTGDDDEA